MAESGPDRRRLELEAEEARARLAETLSALDQRRQDVVDVTRHVEQVAVPAAMVGIGLLVGGASLAALVAWRARADKRVKRKERVRAFARIWNHPERTARRDRSFFAEATRKAALALMSYAAVKTVKYLVDRMDAQPRPLLAASVSEGDPEMPLVHEASGSSVVPLTRTAR